MNHILSMGLTALFSFGCGLVLASDNTTKDGRMAETAGVILVVFVIVFQAGRWMS